ncbi:MAG: thioredoxin-disulfide reductase [Deltaproteobacteria bacterium]|nr:thioredoxin-disulfide reductase [Deltaproteobacteria bacterium]
MEHNVIIIGGACAGLTAAIYSSRANLKPLCIEGYQAGGQLMLTTEVENYPGFPEGIMGPELMQLFRKQAERFGTQFITADATKVDFSKQPFEVFVRDKSYKTKSIIIATGASPNLLKIPHEERLMGHGVSTCATCDGFFFKNQHVVVIGGGDSAMEEATFLTKHASQVTVIHRRRELRASKIMQERAFKNPKIKFIWDTVPTEVLGDKEVTGIKIKNVKTNKIEEFKCQGFFLAIGHTPNTKLFKGQLDLLDNQYLKVTNNTKTSVPGVFSAGDVHDHHYRQAVTAAGSGCMAALDAEKYLESIT